MSRLSGLLCISRCGVTISKRQICGAPQPEEKKGVHFARLLCLFSPIVASEESHHISLLVMVVLHHGGHRVPTLPPRANCLRGAVPNEGRKYLVKM